MRRILTLDYWWHFIKFNVVGLSGVGVNEGAFLLLLYSHMYYLLASAIAIEISIVSNFIFNDYWTFRDRRHGHMAARMAKFNLLMLIGLVVQVAVVFGATTYFFIHPAISQLVGIGVAFLLRYWLSIRFAWIQKREASVAPPPIQGPTPG